jgi:acylphosphatase
MPAIHVSVAGSVQGVGFRWFVRVVGRRLDLRGWVRNCADGTVEVAASGSSEALERLRQALAEGPDSAEVSEIRDLDSIDEELEYPFAVRR